jgi:phosphoglycolate phosphatase
MTIRAILFDKDGTLIDVNATWIPIYREMLMDIFATDLAGAEALMAKAGYDKAADRFSAGSILAGGTTRQLVDTLWPGIDEQGAAEKVRLLDHGYTHLVRDRLTPLMPLDPIFAELRAMGLKLGIGTNDSHVSAKAQMAEVGVIEHFEGIIAADTVAVPKPSGNMIRSFAEITGLAPSPSPWWATITMTWRRRGTAARGSPSRSSPAMPRMRTSRIWPTTRWPRSRSFPHSSGGSDVL